MGSSSCSTEFELDRGTSFVRGVSPRTLSLAVSLSNFPKVTKRFIISSSLSPGFSDSEVFRNDWRPDGEVSFAHEASVSSRLASPLSKTNQTVSGMRDSMAKSRLDFIGGFPYRDSASSCGCASEIYLMI